ncbi:DUF294 nucleotidyltransferase-like domain-containing protein [Vibrio maerlii]|uniref:DUF294 nucleotidyltransferase-like domain-containing protein n=1 Tax=Vibrio maerlii TaxID=2231648 RepID=UPI000E3BBAEF|nr:DUF294 nucleotidyltransferase-like domain-containing protein [Vibrio maerlii]
MPSNFNIQSPPFDRLSKSQQKQLVESLDVAYYRQGDNILKAEQPCNSLFVLIKGGVEERSADSGEIYAHYAAEDLFDVRGLVNESGLSKHTYVALEDTLSYLLPKEVFLSLYQENGQFAAYFDNNLARRQSLLESAHKQQNLAEFILTKVDSSIYHPPIVLSASLSLQQATQALKEHSVDAALVELSASDSRINAMPQPQFGIITRTNLLHAIMLNGHAASDPLGPITSYPVFQCQDGDFLFNAMITMTRNKMKRLMVCDGDTPIGMLDMTQILSSFSTHSHVLSLQIARADSIEELALASNRQRKLVEGLLNNGIRTRFIMELISAVNEQIIDKAFQLVVPPALHDHCCLVVLGSEGRGEQILKTDQDNALIIQDGLEWHQCESVMETLTHTLQQLGYPLCPGQVMVNNPKWVRSQAQWKQTIERWVDRATAETVMNLAIFADAHAVAGNQSLLDPVLSHLSNLMKEQELKLAEFTKPALSFSVPLTLFGNVKSSKSGLDIKQGGIFPIVHGIRALSLENGIKSKNTFNRIETLVQAKVLEPDTADNLSEALKLFFKLRLGQQLANQHTHNKLYTSQLDRGERDILRHSLHVVKKFKQWLGYHYQIKD